MAHAEADKLARRRVRARRRRKATGARRPRRPGFVKRLILRIVGWTFMFLGVLGLFLPLVLLAALGVATLLVVPLPPTLDFLDSLLRALRGA